MPIKPIKLPPQEDLLAKFRYDPETGQLFRKFKHRPEKETGSANGGGYKQTVFEGSKWLCHRIIWRMVTGDSPTEIDHEDGNPSNNAWSNLRSVTRKENMRNRKVPEHNTSGTIGVYFSKQNKKWRAYINFGGKLRVVGHYDDIQDAIDARLAAEKEHGYHKNHGAER